MTLHTVTPADRETFLAFNELLGIYSDAVRAGEWDAVAGMQVIAGYRIATLEAAAQVAERDVDWFRFGKPAADQWDGGFDAARDYRVGIASGRAIAATIRQLKGA